MTQDDVLKMIRRRPFTPLRIHENCGLTLDLKHPDMAVVGLETLVFVSEVDGKEDVRMVSLINISEISTIHGEPAAENAAAN